MNDSFQSRSSNAHCHHRRLGVSISKIRKGYMYQKCLLSCLWPGVLAIFGAHVAAAQSAPLSPTLIQQPPAYCAASKLTGTEFLQAIQKIIAHGNLTDVAYIKKTLRTKFSISYGWNSDGSQDSQKRIYHSIQILGSPLRVSLTIDNDKQSADGRIAYLTFDESQSTETRSNFITDCLHVSSNKFISSYGTTFFHVVPAGDIPPRMGGYVPPPMILYKVLDYPGINNTSFQLKIYYEPKKRTVSQVSIGQYR